MKEEEEGKEEEAAVGKESHTKHLPSGVSGEKSAHCSGENGAMNLHGKNANDGEKHSGDPVKLFVAGPFPSHDFFVKAAMLQGEQETRVLLLRHSHEMSLYGLSRSGGFEKHFLQSALLVDGVFAHCLHEGYDTHFSSKDRLSKVVAAFPKGEDQTVEGGEGEKENEEEELPRTMRKHQKEKNGENRFLFGCFLHYLSRRIHLKKVEHLCEILKSLLSYVCDCPSTFRFDSSAI